MTKEQLQEILAKHIPLTATEYVAMLIFKHNVHLTIKWTRQTKHGDYRTPLKGEQHRITINHSLNKYAFLITLVHELAHLTTFEKYKHKAAAHGKEWKADFKQLMQPLLMDITVFPADVKTALLRYMQNPKATKCGDIELSSSLNRYNTTSVKLVSELAIGTLFSLHDERIFELKRKLRKNYLCKEIKSGIDYSVSPTAEVKKIHTNNHLIKPLDKKEKFSFKSVTNELASWLI